MLNAIVKLLQGLNSNKKPDEIATACCMGMLLGFMPKDNALWFIIFIFFFFVRLNRGAYLIMTALFSLFAWALDPLFNTIGYKILTIPQLENFFSKLLDFPGVGFTKFNNTIVMGALGFSLALYIPVFFLMKFAVLIWRKKVSPVIVKSAFWKSLTSLPIIQKAMDIASEAM